MAQFGLKVVTENKGGGGNGGALHDYRIMYGKLYQNSKNSGNGIILTNDPDNKLPLTHNCKEMGVNRFVPKTAFNFNHGG